VAGLKDTLKEFFSSFKDGKEDRKDLFLPESYKNTDLPNEFKFNFQRQLGCLMFLVIIAVINILAVIIMR